MKNNYSYSHQNLFHCKKLWKNLSAAKKFCKTVLPRLTFAEIKLKIAKHGANILNIEHRKTSGMMYAVELGDCYNMSL